MKQLIHQLLKPLYMVYFKCNWRKHNTHNDTRAVNKFHWKNVSIGKETYGPIEVLYDSGAGRLTIGNFCSIAQNVKFFAGGGHNYRRISTFPFATRTYGGKDDVPRDEKLDIIIEDDVWIGYDCIVLAGAKIGKGSVIGARSVVTGTIPPYSVYVGNKVIKKRFSDELIASLQNIDFSNVHHIIGDDYEKYCSLEVKDDNVKQIVEAFTKE